MIAHGCSQVSVNQEAMRLDEARRRGLVRATEIPNYVGKRDRTPMTRYFAMRVDDPGVGWPINKATYEYWRELDKRKALIAESLVRIANGDHGQMSSLPTPQRISTLWALFRFGTILECLWRPTTSDWIAKQYVIVDPGKTVALATPLVENISGETSFRFVRPTNRELRFDAAPFSYTRLRKSGEPLGSWRVIYVPHTVPESKRP
jgi:hypothetical protein